MAMPFLTPLALEAPSNLAGTVYLFAKEGDILPVHTHTAALNHISFISNGSFRCFGNPSIEGVILTQGQVVDWPANEPHGFVALSDGAKMIQVLKMMAPQPDVP